MPAPTITAIYPNDSDIGVPVSPVIKITFDQDIDLSSVKSNIVLYGADSDLTSGPDLAMWIDFDTGNNPFFLNSPGFKGTVPCDFELVYVDEVTGEEIDPQPDVADETTVSYYHQVKMTPKELLAPFVTYNLYIIGDAEPGTSDAIHSRTVYDVDTSGVTSATGDITVYGGYTGTADTVNIEITTAGDIGTAKYKWWYTSLGPASAITGRLASSRFRKLEDGLQVRFGGSDYQLGDVYTFEVRAPVKLENSYSLSFTTGSGSIQEVPETASTSVIGSTTPITSAATQLQILSMDPPDGATHQSLHGRRITVTFSNELDDTTVTDETVTVTAYPVSGNFTTAYSGGEPTELAKILTVDGDKIIIDI